jgi:glycosyltransferase involved in cell wall biosynthesis
MAPLRIAFDTGPLHGARTGIGAAVAGLADALARRSDVQTVDYVLSFRAHLHPGTVRLPLPASLAHRVWAAAPLPRVDRWLDRAGSVHLVHGTNYVVPPSQHPAVVSVYDLWFMRHPDAASPAVRRASAVLRAAVERGAVVHTSSAATEAAVRELLPGVPVRTVHLGALPLGDAPDSSPLPELRGRPYVVAIGTLERRKNLTRLVEAFGRMAAAHPDLLLVLAGSPGDDSDAITAAIDRLGPRLAPRVLRTGRIPDDARVWLLRQAAVVAYPSLDEGFGFPLLDAMQAGVPLVASTAGSIPEVAGDAALLCPPDDVDGLATALDTALTDDALRTRLVTAGSVRWPQFTWDRCADGMVDLYRDVVQGTISR